MRPPHGYALWNALDTASQESLAVGTKQGEFERVGDRDGLLKMCMDRC